MKTSDINSRLLLSALLVMLSGATLSVDVLAESASIKDNLEFISHGFAMAPSTLSNESLSEINGLGLEGLSLESQKLMAHDQLAVILWDEINKGKHSQTMTSTAGNTNSQSVSLSSNR